MYEWTKNNRGFVANFSECCKHKWTVEEIKSKDGKWRKTGAYVRFDTLEEVREYVGRELFAA